MDIGENGSLLSTTFQFLCYVWLFFFQGLSCFSFYLGVRCSLGPILEQTGAQES